jgi:hypothetical protein
MTACLCIEDWNGKVLVSMYADKATITDTKYRRYRLIDIDDADAGFALALLQRLYMQKIQPDVKPAEQAKAEAASTEAAAQSRKMPLSELLHILDQIIRTSHQQGEIDAALAVFKRVNGTEWRM